MVIQLILLLAYTAISGIKDGILWSKKGSEAFSWNEHIVFVAERITIGVLPLSCMIMEASEEYPFAFDYLALLLTWLLAFSFIHNGFYYETRKRIDVKNYHWFYDSRTSTAHFELNALQRTIMFITSTLLLTSYILLLK